MAVMKVAWTDENSAVMTGVLMVDWMVAQWAARRVSKTAATMAEYWADMLALIMGMMMAVKTDAKWVELSGP